MSSKTKAKLIVTERVKSWRVAAQVNTATKRRDPDNPIGYRYALKQRSVAVGYITVEET